MATSFKFTDRAVAKLPVCSSHTASKAKEYSDLSLSGFKVAVGKSVGGREPNRSFLFRGALNGKKVAITIGSTAMGVEAARARALEIKLALEQGIDPRIKAEPEPAPTAITFGEFFEGPYSEWAKQNKLSFNADSSKYRCHLKDRWGNKPLLSITRRDVEEYLLDLAKQGKASGKPYKPATINRHQSLFLKMFGTAMEWGYIDKNPAKGIKSRKENNVKTTHLKANQIPLLFEKLDQDKNRVAGNAIKLLLLTGARTSEILFLHWTDYDPEAKTIFFRQTKWGPARFLALNTLGVAIVEEMKAYQNGPYIFPGAKDPSKPYNNIKKLLARAMKKAELDKVVQGFTPHCLRHTYASLLASEGVSLYLIQELLGHASPAMTQRYAHLCNDGLRASTQVVADVLLANQTSASPVAVRK